MPRAWVDDILNVTLSGHAAAWTFLYLLFARHSHCQSAVSASFAIPGRRSAPNGRMALLSLQHQSHNIDHDPSFPPFPRVLFESDEILAVDKPHGIPHHDSQTELGILSRLRRCQMQGKLAYRDRLYGVHRLDRVTSGILLLAKNQKAASHLTNSFRTGHVTKYYVGISSKKPKQRKQGWIRGSMVRGRRKAWYLTRNNNNKPINNYAKTRFFSSSLSSLTKANDFINATVLPRTCLLFRPYTGRTHQLRVAAKSVGLPLLGDPTYSDGSSPNNGTVVGRTYLHATALQVTLLDETCVTLWSPPPFHHLWQPADDRKAAALFDATVVRLFEKHCDNEAIRKLAMTSADSEMSTPAVNIENGGTS